MADLRISDLPELLQGALAEDDSIPLADKSASTTKRVSAKNLILDGITRLPDGSIPGSKVAVTVSPDSVGTIALRDNSVTAAKLADGSAAGVGPTLPASGGYVGQLYVTTTGEPQVHSWNGTAWLSVSGVTEIQGDTTGLVNAYVTVTDGIATISADLDNTTAAAQFLAGPTGSGGAVSQRVIAPADLPTAGPDKGAVAVNGGGLTMNGNVVEIDNAVVANTGNGHLVQYTAEGLVSGGAQIGPEDLPLADINNVGAVRPGDGLAVAGDGTLNIDNVIAAGEGTKIRYSEQGLVLGSSDLLATDIPDLPAEKIVSGTFPTGRLADDSVTAPKIADYATCLMQESSPGIGAFLGQLWWQPSTAQLRVYSRSSNGTLWSPVGFGVLQQSQLRWGGTYNASTGEIVSLTTFGSSSGLELGLIPPSTEQSTGVYLLCVEPGSNVNQPDLTGKTHSAGDWIVAVGEEWMFIDITSGGSGGGGGASTLGSLLDVEIDTMGNPLVEGQRLQYAASGMWENTGLIDGGQF